MHARTLAYMYTQLSTYKLIWVVKPYVKKKIATVILPARLTISGFTELNSAIHRPRMANEVRVMPEGVIFFVGVVHPGQASKPRHHRPGPMNLKHLPNAVYVLMYTCTIIA